MMRKLFLWPAMLAATYANAAVLHTTVDCAPTAEAAMDRWLGHAITGEGSDGYRFLRIQQDPLRHQQWALVASCSHPEIPARFMLLASSSAVPIDAAAGVRIGDKVHVMQHTAGSQIDIAGTAMAAGVQGEVIPVRLAAMSADTAASAATIRCRVVAKGLVEVWR